MTIARRRLLQGLALAGGLSPATNGQEHKLDVKLLRDVSTVHGNNLSDGRLRVIQPALERRFDELRDFRSFEIDDAIGPTQGILVK